LRRVDQTIHEVMRYLSSFEPDDYPSLEEVAAALGYSAVALSSIPVIRDLTTPKGIEASLDWTVRDWILYHYYFVHQGYKYGGEDLQQTWLGARIIKNPLDCWVYQEIIHRTKPDMLVELGVAFGGSGLFFADVMELMGHGTVLGVDIDVSRAKDVTHPRIERIEGSSIGEEIVAEVFRRCEGKRVMLFADSDHRYAHVLGELNAYAPLVSPGCYFIVEDTLADILNLMPVPVEGPLRAVREFLAENDEFELDMQVAEKYLMTQSPYGFLRRK
jgi:cephalosporin hydroxylase